MNRPAIAPLILIAALLGAGGCALLNRQAEPADRVAQAEALYTGTATSLLDLRKAGKISDDRWKVIQEVNEAVDEGFESIHAVLEVDGKADVDDMLAGIRASINRLIAYKREAQHGQ